MWLRPVSEPQLISVDDLHVLLDTLWEDCIDDARRECKQDKMSIVISLELDSRVERRTEVPTWRASVAWKSLTKGVEIANELMEPVYFRITEEGSVDIIEPPTFRFLSRVEAEDPWFNPYDSDAPVFQSSSEDEEAEKAKAVSTVL